MSDDLVLPTDEAIETVIAMLRKRLTEARANGQKVRMTARENKRATVPASQFRQHSLREVVDRMKPTSYEIHIYIEGKE